MPVLKFEEISELFPHEKLAKRWRLVLEVLEFENIFMIFGVKGNEI